MNVTGPNYWYVNIGSTLHQTITRANVDPDDLYHYMVWLNHNELIALICAKQGQMFYSEQKKTLKIET